MNTEEKKIADVNFYETDLIKTRKKKKRKSNPDHLFL